MFAVETSPTSQPARVNGTQGAGGVFGGEPAAGTFGEYGMFGYASRLYVPVQYANEDFAVALPPPLTYVSYVFVIPGRAGRRTGRCSW